MAKLEFREPTGDAPAGHKIYKKSKSPYERYMEEENIPIFRGIGVSDLRNLPLSDWKRRGGRGTFLHLRGCESVKGMYVIEVPPRGALNAERHAYDEFFLVVEGRGSTEVWTDPSKKLAFEWQAGTLFTIPINANYRLINATSGGALLLSANNAPPVFNLYQSRRFIFENPADFSDRYQLGEDFFKAVSDIEADEVRGRAAIRSNIYPDIINCELPLDNQRAPGYRRAQPYYHGFIRGASTGGFIAEYPSGRYSKAHYHLSGAVLVCLRGQGYTFNWPVHVGPRPWEAGKGDQVTRLDYGPWGLVAAAPGGGNWFHQHFGISSDRFRVINYWGGPTGQWGDELSEEGSASAGSHDGLGEDEVKAGNLFGIHQGGRTILYEEEDSHIRQYFEERLAEVGGKSTMPSEVYRVGAGL